MTTPSIFSAFNKLVSLLSREEKRICFFMALFSLGTSMLEVITASVIVLLAQILNQPEQGITYITKLGFSSELPPGKIVLYTSILVGIVYLVKNIFAAIEVFFQNFSIQKMNYQFKNKLLNRYAETDYAFYLTRNSSFGTQVVSGDSEKLFSVGMMSMANILSEGIIFVSLISMIIYMNPSLALMIFLIGGIVPLVMMQWVLPKFYRLGQSLQQEQILSSQHLIQFFHAFKEMVLLGRRDSFIRSYQHHARNTAHLQALQTSINSLPRMIIEVLFIGIFVMMITYLSSRYDHPVQMMGLLGGYLYAGFRLMPGLNRMINQLNSFKSVIPSIEQVHREVMMLEAKENYTNVPQLEFAKKIIIQDLSFNYLNTKRMALNHIHLEIHQGEKIGIIGETGSGKSTLVDMILGLLKPKSGDVLVDGLYPVHAYQWHQKIGYVPQSIYLIDDSIQNNILFGETNIDQSKLDHVIQLSQLHSFVQALPEGLQTIVGERGVRLSGGERQRIAIARALYHDPEVLIFDEATSALDHETETRLMETMDRVSQNRTVIMVAHRISTLKNCDRIVVMSQGKIEKITDYASVAHRGLNSYAYS